MTDIATAANVSKSTVSLALRNDARISEERREKIRKIALDLGYIPDPDVQEIMGAVRKAKGSVIGRIAVWINYDWADSIISQQMFDAAKEEAQLHGYELVPMKYSFTPEQASLFLQTCHTRNYVGILIFPPPTPVNLSNLDFSKHAVIAIGSYFESPNFNRVCADANANYRLAFAELRQRGYGKIGIVAEPFDYGRLSYVSQAMEDIVLIRTDTAKDWPSHLKNTILKEEIEVVISDDLETYKLLCEECAFHIPKELSFVKMVARPDFQGTGITWKPQQIGKRAMQELAILLSKNARGIPTQPERILISGEWVEGNTTNPTKIGV